MSKLYTFLAHVPNDKKNVNILIDVISKLVRSPCENEPYPRSYSLVPGDTNATHSTWDELINFMDNQEDPFSRSDYKYYDSHRRTFVERNA